MLSMYDLKKKLTQLDRKSYGAYKELTGSYDFKDYLLFIDHVQGDPFAAPSRLRICVPKSKHGFPAGLFDSRCKKYALEDWLLRIFRQNILNGERRNMGSGKSGVITTCPTGQEVLEQIAVVFGPEGLEARFEVGFPARGRSILAGELDTILFDILPEIVRRSFYYQNLDSAQIQKRMELAENQRYIRGELKKRGLVAFVADGAVLPRESGVSDRPMKKCVPFSSPESMRTVMEVPHGQPIVGMAVKRGVTLIAGGGYHGKSTLLRALESGVYNHILGDGREYVITDETALKVRAEDGRSIACVNLSPFINHLPGGQDTADFVSENASGSTSQAADIIEGIEAGTGVFLIDEDTSATNFMIRDTVMAELVDDEKEPITPFIRRIRGLYQDLGISSVIVVGSSGEYLAAADCVLQLENYRVKDVTKKAAMICRKWQMEGRYEGESFPSYKSVRRIVKGLPTDKYDDYKIKVQGTDSLLINKETVDLRCLAQIAGCGQMASLGYMMRYAQKHVIDGRKTVVEVVNEVFEVIEKKGLAAVVPPGYHAGQPAMARRQELFGCLNRCRGLRWSAR